MKSSHLLFPSSVSLLLLAVLAGCAAGPDPHSGHHGMAGMDPKSMCEKHRQHMAGKTGPEQQALMQEHMKDMKPEMRERMREMHARCT